MLFRSEIFTELEFKTLAKRLLGEELPIPQHTVIEKEIPQGVQTDLFGNIIETPAAPAPIIISNEDEAIPTATRNINNTDHQYLVAETEAEISTLVKELGKHKEICFDTETTSIDANAAELVGLSFSVKPGQAWYIPCPADEAATKNLLSLFAPLFSDREKIWVGQNTKIGRAHV